MSIFNKFSWHSASLFIPLDAPIHKNQIELVAAGFNELNQKTKNKAELLFFKYWDSISTNGYGSFVFIFDDDVLSLTEKKQESINSTLTDIFWGTDWARNWHYWNSYVDGSMAAADKDEFIEHEYFDRFVEAQIASGYKVSIADLYEIFSDYMSKSDVDKKLLFLIIAEPENFVKS